ncbi:MAG: HAD family hydrolase [Candidatus Goldbacteria bacterium]|nr:HAD family hydrolase [Candidatus Goldiibacteriota bacterium]
MKKRTIFFDAGETLIYRNPSLLTITDRFLKKNGININKKRLASVLNECAISMKPVAESGSVPDSKKWEIYVSKIFKKLNVKDNKIMIKLREHLKKGTSYRPFDDTKKTLKHLRKMGFKLGVISNASSELTGILKRTDIYDFFDGIIISEVAGHEKPDVMIFRKALEALKATPEESIYIGDNFIADVKGAIKAGITPVWLHRKSKNSEFSYSGRADKNVFKIKKLSEIIKLMNEEGWI